MNTLSTTWMVAFAALSGVAHAQVPAGNDTSDGSGNTGMGSGALASIHTPNCLVNPFVACFNTASGNQALLNNTIGSGNTALGYQALRTNTNGAFNTATGSDALYYNLVGSYNTATGYQALSSNTDGGYNVASGYNALWFNKSGNDNSAFGSSALASNVSGTQNVAVGRQALTNSTASSNTAVGWQALSGNTSGAGNSALGSSALAFNQVGTADVALGYGALYHNTASNNTATGWQSLNANSSGANNTAAGAAALLANTTGNYATAFGFEALYNSQSGLGNIGIGPFAGRNIVAGELNIDVGSWGTADESNTIRIGVSAYHKHTYISGIYTTTGLSGLPVIVTSSGQLGVAPVSSERFKTGIAMMGSATARLGQLRPVTFRLKSDPTGSVQYGLVAEDVAKVYPELVIRDEQGRIDGVRYDELAPMLLNEVQQQAEKIASLEQQLAGIQASLLKLQPREELVTQR